MECEVTCQRENDQYGLIEPLQTTTQSVRGLYEHMSANDGTTILTFEEWINHLLSESNLTEEEHRRCYTFDGYLIETKMEVVI
ncbi:MAG: hypothetical protein RSA18_04050 [Bacilli bacterium]